MANFVFNITAIGFATMIIIIIINYFLFIIINLIIN